MHPIENALRSTFGFTSFRSGQREAIQNLLNKRHTLAVMPTGAGKSLIFQLAALQLDGVTLVISPLIALMKDQVDSLTRRGIPAAYINSAQSASEQTGHLEHLSRGDYRIVYVAPERLRSVPFLQALRARTVSLLAVDEAHCISEWGHDFRPDYLHIAEARRQLGNPLTAALTATATPKVQDDIIRLLGLADAARIVTGFNRPNLSLNVRYTSGIPAKLRALSELFSSHEPGAVILYTGTRRDAEETAEFVREVVKLPAGFYHAGLPAEERTRIQNDFISGKLNVIAATNAFGMGIDRADVRQVIHYSLPGSLEAYYQEAGRAGRDGLPARVTLLYDPQDRALQEFFIQQSELTERDLRAIHNAIRDNNQVWATIDGLSQVTGMHPVQIRVGLSALERAGTLEHLGDEGYRMLVRKATWNPKEIEKSVAYSKEHIRHRQAQLDGIVAYAETNACRRQIILEHFGDTGPAEAPECCDNCQNRETGSGSRGDVAGMTDGERATLVILDCIRRIKFQVGRGKLAQILHGSQAQDILKFHHDKNVYYGRLAAVKQSDIEALVEQLTDKGYIKVIGGEYPVLRLTPRGETAIEQKESIELKLPGGISPQAFEKKKTYMKAGRTVEDTGQLIEQGLSLDQIARQRGLTIMTIYGHCAKLIEAGKLDVDKVVPKNAREKIEKAIREVGPTQHLWPIKDRLPAEITFEIIRCVVAGLSQTSEVVKTSEVSDSMASIQHIVELGKSKSSDSLPELIAALKSKNGNARRLTASALGKIGNAQAVQPLMDLLATEKLHQVRQYAVKALGSIGDPRATDLLANISEGENEMYYTRDSAKSALQQCRGKKASTKDRLTPFAQISVIQHQDSTSSDPISAYLSSSHPRPLTGPWQSGWSLDFHSRFSGGDWARSNIGDLTFRLKYQGDLSTLSSLVEQTLALLTDHPELARVDAILPVPPSKLRENDPVRAFSSALSDKIKIPVQTLLVKSRQTQPQKELQTLAQKRANVAGAFVVNGSITGKRLLVVDDLFDSGATLEEITRMLLKSGAASVNVFTLTRTIHSDL